MINLNSDINNKVYKICCGGMHTLVLTTMGKLFSWGNNDDGALGREGAENQPTMIDSIYTPMNHIAAGDSHSVAYNTELNVMYLWGAYRVKIFYVNDVRTMRGSWENLRDCQKSLTSN